MDKVPRELLTWHDAPERLSRTHPRYDPEAFFRVKAEYVAREVARINGGRVPAGSLPQETAVRSVWIWGAGRPTRKRAAHLAVQSGA